MLDPLARYVRPLVIAAALLIVAGVMLTFFGMLVPGWATYAIGHVLAILAFVAIAAVNRVRMDGWTWAGLLVLVAGMVLSLPQLGSILSIYYQLPHARLIELPVWTAPLGLTAELVTWVGLAFFGLAARGAHVLPRGIGWVFLGAAVMGVLGDFRLISPLVWVLAVLLMAWGLLGVGVSLRVAERDGVTSSA